MIATATILVGIGSVFAGGGSFSPLWASAIIFTTPLFWQASHVMGLKLMPPLTPTSMTGGRFLYASIVLTRDAAGFPPRLARAARRSRRRSA